MTHTTHISVSVTVMVLTVLLFVLMVAPVSAATMSLSTESQTTRILKLEAKVKYLTAWVAALREGEATPAPTVKVLNSGETFTVFGTLARDPDDARIEVCGPMEKGTIDWDDGNIQSITGLGCSGNVHEFVAKHEYAETGSRHIVITDGQGRSTTHVVWAMVDN